MNKRTVPVALTIAGSDSGGGAGVQADIKTFAALGVHGAAAITAITAQNTCSVRAIQPLNPEIVKAQIKAVAEDMGINAGKTGMLYTAEIVRAVAEGVSLYGFPLVVDPVIVAKVGSPLLEAEAINALKNCLLPKATVITPNKFEAEKLAEMEIKSLEDAEIAARKISELGVKAVVVKGGHFEGVEAVDILYYDGKIERFSASRLDAKTTHGTGCIFSAAITAQIAKGDDIPVAVEKAKIFVVSAIKHGFAVGKGYGPVNPMAQLHREASRYSVLVNVDEAGKLLMSSPVTAKLVPEVGMNVAMAVPYAESIGDVAAFPGRMVKAFAQVKTVGCPCFGGSTHLASYLLEIMKHNPEKRAAINLKFSEETLRLLESKNLKISFYNRMEEPEEIKRVEGLTVPWGVNQAIKRFGAIPDVIYHRGDVGKEPMIVVFGKDAISLARLVVEIAEEMKND
ncbi:MAG: bifunctional hydroxymethylpyrimidine kinase/phosphomethylpyrimidine kinase [Candidatus Bathyarchaeia archaeon]